MMKDYQDQLVDALEQLTDDPQQLKHVRTLAAELSWAEAEEIDDLLMRLSTVASRLPDAALEAGLESVVHRLQREANEDLPQALSESRIDAIRALYESVPAEARLRCMLLGWLACSDQTDALKQWVQLLVTAPPQCHADLAVAFGPLFDRQRQYSAAGLFPKLLDALEHLSVAAAVLDLANFLRREDRVKIHPASERIEFLCQTLRMLTEQLAMVEEGQPPEGASMAQVSQMVNEAVPLITALCDSLSLIGDPQAVGPLNRASELKHRRLRTEALSALCQLGQQDAAAGLLEMAQEPVARLRVLKYAEELGLIDQVADQWTTSAARAESELAMWLAHPSNMGIAPSQIELIDTRTMAWPSFDEPQSCFLFRYVFRFSGNEVENIGMVGPTTHAFATSLLGLPVSDLYACFAGWHCTHENIIEMSINQARMHQPGAVERLMSYLASHVAGERDEWDSEPRFLGMFMGEPVLVVSASGESGLGTYVVDQQAVSWFDALPHSDTAFDRIGLLHLQREKALGRF